MFLFVFGDVGARMKALAHRERYKERERRAQVKTLRPAFPFFSFSVSFLSFHFPVHQHISFSIPWLCAGTGKGREKGKSSISFSFTSPDQPKAVTSWSHMWVRTNVKEIKRCQWKVLTAKRTESQSKGLVTKWLTFRQLSVTPFTQFLFYSLSCWQAQISCSLWFCGPVRDKEEKEIGGDVIRRCAWSTGP